MDVKQTLSEIALRPTKKHGQNFLKSRLVAKHIVDNLNLQKADYILEIGPGLGALTEHLCQTKEVVAIESSHKLFTFLKKRFLNKNNIVFYNDDILHFDLQLLSSKMKYKVVSNLPYSLATHILKLFLPRNDRFDYLYFSFPEEVASKIITTKKSSTLSIFVHLFSFVTKILVLESSTFYPQPKVKTVFLSFKLLKNRFFDDPNQQEQFLQFVYSCFVYPRKTIVNNLRERYNLSCKVLDSIKLFLLRHHNSARVRAESLNVERFFNFFDYFRSVHFLD